MMNQEWYDAMLIVMEDAPEILGEFCEKKAKELGVSVEYFMEEFMSCPII